MMNGIINVLKPPGMTSHDVVSFIRRTKKIDPNRRLSRKADAAPVSRFIRTKALVA